MQRTHRETTISHLMGELYPHNQQDPPPPPPPSLKCCHTALQLRYVPRLGRY